MATGITERAAHAVLQDLREAGIVHTERQGRQNVNHVDPVALANHQPWGSSDMEFPKQLIDATIKGLATLATEPAAAEAS
jgi:hypothetical protein